ncbi:hypothetical protein [Leptolyngbya sp. NIES-2104]|uniref:hypothetical protein n=1 Tax=Leptolyngbya sp. NIES-2104 TaxID=1552121 RepID=UPI0006EC627B|nr:hypothetical protein [Leptolyngbya sp. NIES-2104]GAP97258.1 hypothetical protein NIES2104_38050 [Leptolyngbya sp. NIES-2104]
MKKILGLISLAIVAVMVAVTTGHAQDLPLVGFLFDGRSAGDSRQAAVSLVGIRFTGECPGELSPSTSARFFSKSTQPAPELRAVVRNVTFGFAGEQKPFTDREYFNGDVSEGFVIRFGDRHEGKFLAVRPGENQFEYEIRRGKQSIETGKFSATFDSRTFEQERDARLVWRETKYCVRYEKKRCVKERVSGYYERTCS